MTLQDKDIDYVARLAHVHLRDDEKKLYLEQLGGILNYVEKLNTLDTRAVPAMDHVLEQDTVWREDIVRDTMNRDKFLKGAPKTKDGFFLVPPVIEKS